MKAAKACKLCRSQANSIIANAASDADLIYNQGRVTYLMTIADLIEIALTVDGQQAALDSLDDE